MLLVHDAVERYTQRSPRSDIHVQSHAYLHVYITLRLRSFANGTPVSYDPFVLVLRKCILQTQYMCYMR